MKRKAWAYLILAAIVICAVIVVSVYNKPHASVADEEADFKLSASQLIEAFSSDEQAANARYVGKILEVNGPIRDVIVEDQRVVLYLGDTNEMTGVSCYLGNGQTQKYSKLEPDQHVTVKGICNGFLLDVVLDKCVLQQPEAESGRQ